MNIDVELYGIPRQRAGVPRTSATGARLGEVLTDLASRYPGLAETCFDGQRLQNGFIANLNGQRFITDPDTLLAPGDSLLIFSADAGG